MDEAIKFTKSNVAYINIFNAIYNKYKIHGKVTGQFVIEGKNEDEIRALQNFDTNVVITGKAKIKSKKVEELYLKRFKEIDFLKLIEEIAGESIITNKELLENKIKTREGFFLVILETVEEGVGKCWLENIINDKTYGYKSIIQKYNELSTNLELSERLIKLINIINNLPYISGEFQSIVLFSANKTRNPHFFDTDRFEGKLLINALCNIFNKQQPIDIVETTELYYLGGLLKDEISNTTTIYGLNAYKKNIKVKSISEFNLWNEPLEISISNILNIDEFKPIGENVYIFENPTVFHEVLKLVKGKASLICTKGQLNLSSHLIIQRLKDVKNIYYAGDFDPEGLIIGKNIKNRYGEIVKFLFYERKYYESIKSDIPLEKSRIKKLDKVNLKELSEIKECIIKEEYSAYQELLIKEYIEFIVNNN